MEEGQGAAPADVVSRIDAILASEKPAEPQPVAEPVEEAAQPVEEAPAETNQQVEGEAAPADVQMAEIPLDQLEAIELEVTVKGEDGKDVVEKPSIKALREGYMRQKDYQRKTAEVARQREEVGEKVRQAIDSERSSYQQTLQQLQALVVETVAPELKDVNWNHLAANDPFEYVRLRNRADQITQALATVKSKTDAVTVKQKAEQAETLKKVAIKARETLDADIPGFNDDLYNSLIKSSETWGYKQDEVAQWVDPRAIKILHDAYQFRQLKADKPIAQNKVAVAPRVIKPGTAAPSRAAVQHGQAMERLTKSGKIEDAAAVIRARMG